MESCIIFDLFSCRIDVPLADAVDPRFIDASGHLFRVVFHPGFVATLERVIRYRVVDHSGVVRLLIELEFAVGESNQSTLGFRNVMTDAFRFHLADLKEVRFINGCVLI